MGMTIEKMYGSYSDADLNDWEKLPLNVNVLTSSAFGAWLLRRDERRDTSIKADYENRLKADMVAMLTELQLEIKESENCGKAFHLGLQMASNIIQQKINTLRGNEDGNDKV